METRNRIVMSPMGTNFGEQDGRVSERTLRYYEARALGGAGLIIVGVAAIAYPEGKAIPRQLGISDDRFLPGLTALAERIRRHGARAAIQLQHAGKVATQDIAAGIPLLVPSLPQHGGGMLEDLTGEESEKLLRNLMRPGARLDFHELTGKEIPHIVARFADAAERARRAGFDGVEIHAGHGYLISAFLSRATNRRTDAYGGSAGARARLLVEVIRAAKDRAGADFPVWCRLDAREYRIEDGITLEESRETARLAEAAGADALHVSAYGNPTSGIAFTEAPLVHEPGAYLTFAAAIKREVRIPVIAVGRISPEEGERVLRAGGADFIAMGRKLLADPELPLKLRDGRPEDVRPCVYGYTCVGNIFVGESVACAANPATGREAELAIEKAATPRRVLVIGGGPAGLEAARVAALRGHRVVLCEKERRLGGALFFSSLLWEPNGELVDHLVAQIRKLPIDVRLGQEVTPALVGEIDPEVILVATGARHVRPAIPGADRRHVLDGADLRDLFLYRGVGRAARRLGFGKRALLRAGCWLGVAERPAWARRLSRLWMPLGRRVVIVGGGLVGIELAEFLAERGRRVTVVEEGEWLASEMALPRRWRALDRLRERGADLRTGVRVEEITETGVRLLARSGESDTVPADAVLLAAGVAPDPRLAEVLGARHPAVRALGDCRAVGFLAGALEDGARAARDI
jgi:2,4-dienoyl-CoA reductase (NADPH2)